MILTHCVGTGCGQSEVELIFWGEVALTMLIQATAITMYLGLNCMF